MRRSKLVGIGLLFGTILVGCGDTNEKQESILINISNTTIPVYDPVGLTLESERLKSIEREANAIHNSRSRSTQVNNQRRIRSASASVPTDDLWYKLFGCETGGTYNAAINTGNGYYGAFQFSLTTWQGIGESGYPHQFSYEHQRAAAQRLQIRDGWKPWPACSRKLGLR